MIINLIQVQTQLKLLGLYSGNLDGLAGPKTTLAIERFQRLYPPLSVDGVIGSKTLAKLNIDIIENRDGYSQSGIISKFGIPGQNLCYLQLPFNMRLAWDPKYRIAKFQCHEAIRNNLEVIFKGTLEHYGLAKIRELGLDLFGGCFNLRSIRGGIKLSTHSWGISIDLDPAHNQLHWGRDKARFATKEYAPFWQIVEANGGYSFGRIKNFDYMHIQFMEI